MGRKFNLLASTALTTSTAFVSGAAFAADLRMPVKAAPADPPYYWNGCYGGLNAGLVSAKIDQQLIVPGIVTIDSHGRDSGFIGGAQLGCNYVFSPNWLVGVEGDINYVDLKRSRSFAFTFSGEDTVGTQSTKLRWLATVRGRLGYTWNRTLFYGTGGLAIGKVESSVSASVATGSGTALYFGSESESRIGWTLGTGIEHAFTNKVTGKLEYLHFDLGDFGYNVVRVSGTTFLPATWGASAKVSGDIVRLGFNVKLN